MVLGVRDTPSPSFQANVLTVLDQSLNNVGIHGKWERKSNGGALGGGTKGAYHYAAILQPGETTAAYAAALGKRISTALQIPPKQNVPVVLLDRDSGLVSITASKAEHSSVMRILSDQPLVLDTPAPTRSAELPSFVLSSNLTPR